MGAVVASPHDLEDEQAGDLTLELIAVRYTGEQTIYDVTQHLAQAGWPGMAALNGGPDAESVGPWNVALVADRHLSKYEGRPDIEVVYADQRERFAEIILDMDDDPRQALENVFGAGSNPDVRERVFNALGLETAAEGGPFRKQLRDIAGIDDEDAADEDADTSLVSDLTDAYSRAELADICKALRPEPSAFNLNENAGKLDRAEYIAGFEQADRKAAIDAAVDDPGGDA